MKVAGRLMDQIASSQLGKRILGGGGKELLQANIPGAVTTSLFTLAGGGGIPAALTTGLLDMGLSYGGAKLAGKRFPGAMQTVIRDLPGGGVEKTKMYQPSSQQQIAMGAGTVAAPLLVASIFPAAQIASEDPRLLQQLTSEPVVMDQTAALEQQVMQRQMINKLGAQALAPGTNFQMAGIESTLTRGMQVPPGLDPYGLMG